MKTLWNNHLSYFAFVCLIGGAYVSSGAHTAGVVAMCIGGVLLIMLFFVAL